MLIAFILAVFLLGYLAIAMEHKLGINKAPLAMLIGVVCWTLYVVNLDSLLMSDAIPEWFQIEAMEEHLENVPLAFAIEAQHLHQTGEIASILFFLLGAMTIVELIDANDGFGLITSKIRTTSKRRLFWMVGALAFGLSAILDNLTTTIVLVSLLRKLVTNRDDRLLFLGFVVIAANAGGAWTVIGDVTTTMLWIKHRISAVDVMQLLFVPSVVCLVVPAIGMSLSMTGTLEERLKSSSSRSIQFSTAHRLVFLIVGVLGLISVPAFKAWTHLPPYMGMLLSLSVLWIVSELMGRDQDEQTQSETGVLEALRRVDISSILFFLGILLAVGALSAIGILTTAAGWLDASLPNRDVVAIVIGLLSSVVDNVPLVAAGIDMYDMPANDRFWLFLAYCAGTGGSCLIIGSAAGVAAMGMEHIDFVWYLKKVAPWALAGYLAGAAAFVLLN